MTLSVRLSPGDAEILQIYSGAVLIGTVSPTDRAGPGGEPKSFRWATCFSRFRKQDESGSVQEAALAIAGQWRAWLKDAALIEAPAQDDPYRRAFVAVHKALHEQRAAIEQLRGVVQSNRERRRAPPRKAPRFPHRAQPAAI